MITQNNSLLLLLSHILSLILHMILLSYILINILYVKELFRNYIIVMLELMYI